MEEFNKVYEKIYKENYFFLEKLRKRSKQNYDNIYGLLFLFIVEAILFKINIGIAVMFLLVMFIGMVVLIVKSFKKFKGEDTYAEEYQKRVIKPLIQLYDENIKYSYKDGIGQEDYMYGLMNDETYESNNLIEKKINNVIIKASQVVVEEHYQDTEYTDIVKEKFSGIFVRIAYDDCSKKICFS